MSINLRNQKVVSISNTFYPYWPLSATINGSKTFSQTTLEFAKVQKSILLLLFDLFI